MIPRTNSTLFAHLFVEPLERLEVPGQGGEVGGVAIPAVEAVQVGAAGQEPLA